MFFFRERDWISEEMERGVNISGRRGSKKIKGRWLDIVGVGSNGRW